MNTGAEIVILALVDAARRNPESRPLAHQLLAQLEVERLHALYQRSEIMLDQPLWQDRRRELGAVLAGLRLRQELGQ